MGHESHTAVDQLEMLAGAAGHDLGDSGDPDGPRNSM